VPVREPGPGEVLVRNTWTSVDPGLRLRLANDLTLRGIRGVLPSNVPRSPL
jgi:NADPH-dependent curcumin reductase CurA